MKDSSFTRGIRLAEDSESNLVRLLAQQPWTIFIQGGVLRDVSEDVHTCSGVLLRGNANGVFVLGDSVDIEGGVELPLLAAVAESEVEERWNPPLERLTGEALDFFSPITGSAVARIRVLEELIAVESPDGRSSSIPSESGLTFESDDGNVLVLCCSWDNPLDILVGSSIASVAQATGRTWRESRTFGSPPSSSASPPR